MQGGYFKIAYTYDLLNLYILIWKCNLRPKYNVYVSPQTQCPLCTCSWCSTWWFVVWSNLYVNFLTLLAVLCCLCEMRHTAQTVYNVSFSSITVLEIQGHTERNTSKWALTLMFSLALSIDVQNSPSEPLYRTQMAVLLLCTVKYNLYKGTNTCTFLLNILERTGP